MLSKKMEKALNEQVQAEFFSAYMYLSMSLQYEGQSLKGIAHWLKAQYEEEREHAHKIIDFMLDRGAVPELKDIKASHDSSEKVLQTFEKVLAHEKHVTELIHNLYQLAISEKDYATQIFLQWFVSEQVEEEASVSEIIDKLKLVKDHAAALLAVDAELGKRKE